jgi:hypothetical protein
MKCKWISNLFPVNTTKLQPDLRGKELTREVAYEKTPYGREIFKITIKAFGHGEQGSSMSSGLQPTEPSQVRAVRLVI